MSSEAVIPQRQCEKAPGEYKYRAFVSYSHAADGKLAPTVQRALHRLAKPWYRMRQMRVFRDKTSLAVTPALWPTIVKAMEESAYFLLLASPRAAASDWVQQEVSWWLAHRSPDRLLIAVTEGDLVWDAQTTDFDWHGTTALPAILAKAFDSAPLYVDLRWARSIDTLSLRHSQFRAAVLDLAATLHGVDKDKLDGDDVRQYRWTRIVASIAIILILAGAGIAVWQWRVAVQEAANAKANAMEANRQRGIAVTNEAMAKRERDEATRQATLAELREQAAVASSLKTSNPSKGLLLAMLATDRSVQTQRGQVLPSVQASLFAFADLLQEDNVVAEVGPTDTAVLARHPVQNALLAGGTAGVWKVDLSAAKNASDGDRVAMAACGDLGGRSNVSAVVFDAKGSTALAGYQVCRWTPSGEGRAAIPRQATALALLEQGRLLLVGGESFLELWDVQNDLPVKLIEVNDTQGVVAMAVAPGGDVVAVSHQGGRRVELLSYRGRRLEHGRTLDTSELPTSSLSFAATGRWLASGSNDGRLRLWDLTTEKNGPTQVLPVWDQGSAGQNPLKQYRGHTSPVLGVAFAPKMETVAAVSYDGFLRLWTIEGRPLGEFRASSRALRSLVWSPDGREIFTVDAGGTIRRWSATWQGLMTIAAQTMANTPIPAESSDLPHAREIIARYK